jgi:NAD(P)-dependent dehydrogenase (short-subunit alcohol dehydrogenase family)
VQADPRRWRVVVTGGASGLGAAVTDRLHRLGAWAAVLDRRSPTGSAAHHELVDLADPRAAEAAVERAVAAGGGLDAVVTCAGVDVPGRLDTVAADDWERVVAVNLVGTAAVVRAALPALRDARGRVVTVASTLGHRAVSDATAYCASKWGVVGFTRALQAELKGQVGVTLLTPGGMRTAFFDGRDAQYRPSPGAPLADPGDVAGAVLFALGQPDGCAVQELVVTGPDEPSWP